MAGSDIPTFSVTELCETVRLLFETGFPEQIWVRGEIHDLKRPPSGHVYFDLLDPGELGRSARAKLSVALFANKKFQVNAILKRAGGVRMTDGVEVRIRGNLEFHAPTGQVKFVMTLIDPEYTLGRLAADRDRLLRELAESGLLNRQKALELSPAPLHIALVTSMGSAAAEDFLDELRRSSLGFRVTAIDSRVQGEGAVANLVAALHTARRTGVDLVALVRGGGARTDLATFDSAEVARAVAGLDVPVWTGIGHEIDRAVVDEVAHTAFKTPTACAAALVDRVTGFLAAVQDRWAQLHRRSQQGLAGEHARVDAAAGQVARQVGGALRVAAAGLDARAMRLAREGTAALRDAERMVASRAALVGALDPARTLARGWSITRTAEGRLVRSPADVASGELLVTMLAEGELRSTVTGRD